MPESYIEPMTDRQTCFKCNKTADGKKKFSKCNGCHAVTYCGRECQREDWPRHSWNCVPVMVTEIPGKGRGLVAARDIKMGELIFNDKPAIKLSFRGRIPSDPDFMQHFKSQIDNLPIEAKSQFNKLTAPTDDQDMNIFIRRNLAGGNKEDARLLKKFIGNSLGRRNNDSVDSYDSCLFLNHALVNHSCAPNAASGRGDLDPEKGVQCHELRAIKDISKGEEIATCYVGKIWEFGFDVKKRRSKLSLQFLSFVCKCAVCLGKIPGQEEIGKRLKKLHSQLSDKHYLKDSSAWRKETDILSQIVDLTLTLHVGKVDDKFQALNLLIRRAHLARDEDLVKKSMKTWKEIADNIQLSDFLRSYEIMERGLDEVPTELNSNNPPSKTEIDLIFSIDLNV